MGTHPPSASTSTQPHPPPSTCGAYPYSSTLAIDIRDLPSQTPASLYTAGVPTTTRQTFSRRFRSHTTRAGQHIHPAPTFPRQANSCSSPAVAIPLSLPSSEIALTHLATHHKLKRLPAYSTPK